MAAISNAKIMSTVLDKNAATYANLIKNGNKPFMAMQAYEQGTEDFLKDLVTKIVLQKVRGFMFKNTLEKFKKGDIPLGDAIEDIYVGLVDAHEYDPDGAYDGEAEFGQENPDVDVCYHKVNAKRYYKVSVSDERLKSAFNTTNGLYNLVNEIVGTPVRSNNYDEYRYTKELFTDNLPNTYVVGIEGGVDIAKNLLEAIKIYSARIEFANTIYNRMQSNQTCVLPYQELILPVDMSTKIDLDVLAAIFNLNKAEITTKMTKVDSFKDSNILGWLVDGRAVQIYNHIITSRTNYVASKMMTNIFFHVHQLYSFSLYGTNIAFADKDKFKAVTKEPSYNDFTLGNSEQDRVYPGSMVVVVPNPTKTVQAISYKANTDEEWIQLPTGETTFTYPVNDLKKAPTTTVAIKVEYTA